MVAEADGEGLVAGFEDLVEEGFDILLVLLDELLLTAAGVDDEADAQRELIVVGEEADLLRHTVFDDREVVFGETGYDPAFCIVDADGGVDEVGFDLNDGDTLRVGQDWQEKDGVAQLWESKHDGGTCCLRSNDGITKGTRGFEELFRSKKNWELVFKLEAEVAWK
jgi:hypothetical protein